MRLGARAVHSAKAAAAPVVFLVALTFGEGFVFQRLLFRDRPEYEFALASIPGVLGGSPAFKSWQQRLLGPWLVRLLESRVGDPLRAFELYLWWGLLLANALLYLLLRRRSIGVALSALGVVCFVVVRVVYAYRLEYPWDELDVLLFLGFGFWVAQGGALSAILPLLVLGTLNHEIALYLPFWYVLGAILGGRRRLGMLAGASCALAVMAGVTAYLRNRLYIGPPHLPGLAPEATVPLVDNNFHLAHNLKQLLIEDWRSGKVRIAASLWLALFLLVREIVKRTKHAQAVLWSLCVFGSVLCFGYVNETRLYLPLIAFWFAYAWPPFLRDSGDTA